MLRGGLRPWSETMVSEGARPWNRGRSGDCEFRADGVATVSRQHCLCSLFFFFPHCLCGPYPRYGWDFPEEIPEKFRNFFRKRSQSVSWNSAQEHPKPFNSRHLRRPKHFQNSLPLRTAGDASFFKIGSREGLSELVMEFPAVLGVFRTLVRANSVVLDPSLSISSKNMVNNLERLLIPLRPKLLRN